MKHAIIGTAGHIDHGKSSLIYALTHKQTDRLPEEQKRGVSIELGFAHYQQEDWSVYCIDVPGHADFIHNMVTGVSCLDLVLFVVAADDNWMPQSEEHLHILQYFGCQNAIIVLNKIDVVDDLDFAEELLREELANSWLADAPCVRVSTKTGSGIAELQQTILQKLTNKKSPADTKQIPRFWVDRAFNVKGVGTVVTGSVQDQGLVVGDTLQCYPEEYTTRIRAIQNHQIDSEVAPAHSRAGLHLSDLSIQKEHKQAVTKGMLLAPVGSLHVCSVISVHIERIDRTLSSHQANSLQVKSNQHVMLHIGSTKISGRLMLVDKELPIGASCFAQLRLQEPHAFAINDRFLLRDMQQTTILAGGIILETNAMVRGWQQLAYQQYLQQCWQQRKDWQQLMLLRFAYYGFIAAIDIGQGLAIVNTELQRWLKQQIEEAKIIKYQQYYVFNDWIISSAQLIKAVIKQQQEQQVLIEDVSRQSASITQLYRHAELVEYIEKIWLEKHQIIAKLNCFSDTATNNLMPKEWSKEADSIYHKMRRKGFTSYAIQEIAPHKKQQDIIAVLVQQKRIICLQEGSIYLPDIVMDAAIAKITTLLTTTERATVAEIRDCLQTTRKLLIPLLEYLDNQGVTKRKENYRVLTQ